MNTIDLGTQLYVYAYPLVLMDVTQKAMTHDGANVNTFVHVSEFPTDEFKDIVRPNVDTLYSFAWLDLARAPIKLSVPDTQGRYYLMELMDAWTNVFASLGKRTTGTNAQDFLIVGPRWTGVVPEGAHKIQSPTDMVLILARTQTNGKNDYDFVHKIQAGYQLAPLGSPAQALKISSVASAIGTHTAPVDKVAAMDVQTFYTIFAHALKNNPPAEADAPMLERLKSIGIVPGKDFDGAALSTDLLAELTQGKKQAFKEMTAKMQAMKRINGWGIMLDIGTYGTDYLTRAMIALIGIGANLPVDAVYPTAFVDADGQPLNGKNKYVIHFDKDQLPPANAFWSITMYNAESFLIKNPLHRYALGDRDNLMFNADGSLDIFILHESPGTDKESNWLPAPEGSFNLTMRIYWPQESVLNGEWAPPGIKKINKQIRKN